MNSGAGYLFGLARAKQRPAVQAELDALNERYKEQFPGNADAGKYKIAATPLEESLLGSSRSSLMVLLGAVGFVLLIACANVASLLLARASTRRREVAIRMAIGASSRQIVQQILTESVLLSFIGGALGVGLAAWSLPLLMRLAVPATLPRSGEVHVDAGVLLFSAGLCCVTGVLFGIGPALQVIGSALSESLKEGARGSTARGGLREIAVVCEVALALVLMTGAGLLIKSFVNLMHVNPGFESAHLTTFGLTLPAAKYNKV